MSKQKIPKQEQVQPEVNIGLIGHVDHGKTTLTQRLSGKWTDTHSEELKRGITIRLGYADSSFYKCPKCKGFDSYGVKKICEKCNTECKFLRKVSFVDSPGHESLMATMLCGAAIIDGAILIVSADENCPQPQTREHLMALSISGVENVIVVQNKIDSVDEKQAKKNYEQIKNFLAKTRYKDAVIIPISAQHNINIDILIEAIEKFVPTPKRDPKKSPLMFVARSFDINKPGTKPNKILGGVLGGSLKQGVLKVDEEIEILPGYEVTENNQKIYKPLHTKITSLISGGSQLKEVHPGGSIACMTSLDPSIIKSDSLTGSIIGLKGKLPKVWYELKLKTHLLERVIGAKADLDVEPIKMREILMLNVNSSATVGSVYELGKDLVKVKLKKPVCAEVNSRVTISRMIGSRFRLIGYGEILE